MRLWDVVYIFAPAEAGDRLEAWCATGGGVVVDEWSRAGLKDHGERQLRKQVTEESRSGGRCRHFLLPRTGALPGPRRQPRRFELDGEQPVEESPQVDGHVHRGAIE